MQFIISFIDFLFFFLLTRGGDVCNYIVTSPKPGLVSQYFSTFPFKRMHMNNNEGEKWRQRGVKFRNVVQGNKRKKEEKNITSPYPNMIYDSAGELHVMIQHVDQGFVQRCVIQKYCSEAENRQRCRSITPELRIVHSGILPEATAHIPPRHHSKIPPPLSTTQQKYAFDSDKLDLVLLSSILKKRKSIRHIFKAISVGKGARCRTSPSYFNISARLKGNARQEVM